MSTATTEVPKTHAPRSLHCTGSNTSAAPGVLELSGNVLPSVRRAVQVSDWGARPLSARQVTYAAMDAAVQLRLLAAMTAPGGPLPPADVAALAKPWHAGASPPPACPHGP